MKKEKSFYIGWQDTMPKENKSTIRKFVISIFIALPLLAFAIIYAQKGFNNFQFELGKSTELTGIFHSSPVPVLEVTEGALAEGLSKDVLLVGYGKMGAEGIIVDIESSKGKLDGRKVTMRGTLIYGDGKTLMELTKKSKSLVEIYPGGISPKTEKVPSRKLTMTGEILDPKCYFGVMKPAEGKIHKSCAIRCISGGIPPVFRTKSLGDKNEYYILLGENGERINKRLLDMVAENVEVSGTTHRMHGWDYLYLDPAQIKLVDN